MNKQPTGALRTFAMAFVVLAMLGVISFIPPLYAEDFTIRRTNIFSELYSFNDQKPESLLPPEVDVADFEVDFEQVAQQVAEVNAEPSPTAAETSLKWEVMDDTPSKSNGRTPTKEQLAELDFASILPAESRITKIEDFAEADSPLQALYDKMLSGESIHIGFMGDSFVEGDILTCDLRQLLQGTFGGGGVGYAPFASPHTQYRRTIKTTSKGWNPYHIILDRNIPEPYSGDFFVSGWVAKAQSGASTRWEMTSHSSHAEQCNSVRLYFIARQGVKIELTLNDSENRSFSFEGGEQVRQILVESQRIHSVEMKIVEGAAGFTAIGAEFFNPKGVSLDNLAIRSNNGQAMFRTNPAVNAQINNIHPYDLIVLQYGLNILTAERKNYSLYADQIEKMVRYVRQCFPEAAILIMGVSDRSSKNENGDMVSMESAKSLSSWQREAAQKSGAAFWSTYDAMQRLGGIDTFVEHGWAGKDYTHIGYNGGRKVAEQLFYAIMWDLQDKKQELEMRWEKMEPVIKSDSTLFQPAPTTIEPPTPRG